MPRMMTTRGLASTTRPRHNAKPNKPDDSTLIGWNTAYDWFVESLTTSRITNRPLVVQTCETAHPDALAPSPNSHVQLYGPTPPVGWATSSAGSPMMAGEGPTPKGAVSPVMTSTVCELDPGCRAESEPPSRTRY